METDPTDNGRLPTIHDFLGETTRRVFLLVCSRFQRPHSDVIADVGFESFLYVKKY